LICIGSSGGPAAVCLTSPQFVKQLDSLVIKWKVENVTEMLVRGGANNITDCNSCLGDAQNVSLFDIHASIHTYMHMHITLFMPQGQWHLSLTVVNTRPLLGSNNLKQSNAVGSSRTSPNK
jgi:hypothetical protein